VGEPTSAYAKGVEAGEIAARLLNHDKHFEALNGSLKEIAKSLGLVTQGLQSINDQMETRDKVLKELEDARATKAARRWTPFTRVFAVLAAVSTLVSILVTVFTLRS
jgi:hypothetical protein